VIALIIVVVAVLLAMGIQRLGGKDANESRLEGA
jgi:raffinose/stachyose/melibiose transport system permease protein